MNLFDEQTWSRRLADLTQPEPSSQKILRVGDCVVDCRTGLVQTLGQTSRLRRKELELLTYLHECDNPVGRDQLLRDVWNCSNVVTRTVDQTVATLRRKLNDDSSKPKYLLTIYGIGYQLRKVLTASPLPR
jgi:DNA-binding response OmpR family regulator